MLQYADALPCTGQAVEGPGTVGLDWQQHKVTYTLATELVLDRPGFFWPSYHLLDNSSSHVAD